MPAIMMTAYGRTTLTIATTLAVAASLAAQPQRPAKDSPFLPPAGATAPAATGPAAYELTGMSVVGKDTLLSVLRVSDKRSTWIPVGKTVSEITAVSYDPAKDEAVIRVDGRTLNLTMRKSAAVTGPVAQTPPPLTAPLPQAATPAQAVPAKPLTPTEEKETEARMLVTDLLEIGQQQRRAYEEAQRQAAAKNSSASAATAPATGPATAPAR